MEFEVRLFFQKKVTQINKLQTVTIILFLDLIEKAELVD